MRLAAKTIQWMLEGVPFFLFFFKIRMKKINSGSGTSVDDMESVAKTIQWMLQKKKSLFFANNKMQKSKSDPGTHPGTQDIY